jgi:hypothetical protein
MIRKRLKRIIQHVGLKVTQDIDNIDMVRKYVDNKRNTNY